MHSGSRFSSIRIATWVGVPFLIATATVAPASRPVTPIAAAGAMEAAACTRVLAAAAPSSAALAPAAFATTSRPIRSSIPAWRRTSATLRRARSLHRRAARTVHCSRSNWLRPRVNASGIYGPMKVTVHPIRKRTTSWSTPPAISGRCPRTSGWGSPITSRISRSRSPSAGPSGGVAPARSPSRLRRRPAAWCSGRRTRRSPISTSMPVSRVSPLPARARRELLGFSVGEETTESVLDIGQVAADVALGQRQPRAGDLYRLPQRDARQGLRHLCRQLSMAHGDRVGPGTDRPMPRAARPSRP